MLADGALAAVAQADGGGGGGIDVRAMLPTAIVSGWVRAYAGEGVSLDAGSLTVAAGGPGDSVTMNATATSKVGSVSAAGGAGAKATATVSGLVEAFVGTTRSETPGAAVATRANVSGAAVIRANSNLSANATAEGGSGGGFTVSVMLPTAKATGTTRAYVGEGTQIDAGTLSVTATADKLEAIARAFVLSVNIGGGGAGAKADSEVGGLVEAFLGTTFDTAASSRPYRPR